MPSAPQPRHRSAGHPCPAGRRKGPDGESGPTDAAGGGPNSPGAVREPRRGTDTVVRPRCVPDGDVRVEDPRVRVVLVAPRAGRVRALARRGHPHEAIQIWRGHAVRGAVARARLRAETTPG